MPPFTRKHSALNIKAIEIAKILQRAGWEYYQTGHHYTATKTGSPTVRWRDPVDLPTWRNVETALNVSLETLINKSAGRAPVTRDQWVKRIELAKQLVSSGFPTTWACKQVRLTMLLNAGMKSADLASLSVDEIIDKWVVVGKPVKTQPNSHRNGPLVVRQVNPPLPSYVPPISDPVELNKRYFPAEVTALADVSEPVQVHEEPAIAPVAPAAPISGDLTAMLELLGEMHADIRTNKELPVIRARLQRLRNSITEVQADIDALMPFLPAEATVANT